MAPRSISTRTAPARSHTFDGRGHQIVRNVEVDEPWNSADGVVGMQRRQHHVPGHRRLNRDLRGCVERALRDTGVSPAWWGPAAIPVIIALPQIVATDAQV